MKPSLYSGNLVDLLASQGKVFYASDADQNDLVTGQTSFANTTPTFLLDIPSGTVAVPLMMTLCQTGTVAGGAVDIIMEFDNATRYASGGTSETAFNARSDKGAVYQTDRNSRLFTGATASAGYGIRVMGLTTGQDVSPAEGAVQEIIWTPPAGFDFLVGPASWAVYTYAGTTGPTWFWTFKWAEWPYGEGPV